MGCQLPWDQLRSDRRLTPAGNVCVTGTSSSPCTNNDYATIKYNASGPEGQ